MDSSQRTESLRLLIKNIESDDLVLPEFQRDFVWEQAKTYELFDSIVKDIFIGSLIYGIPSFEITVRELDNRPRKGKGSRIKLKLKSIKKDEIEKRIKIGNLKLVLDGQQRITSIYRALIGIDPVWFVCKNDDELKSDGKIIDFELEELLDEFTGQESVTKLSIKIADVYKITQNNYREQEIKNNFFNKLSFISNLTDTERIEAEFTKYLTLKNKLDDLFKAEKLLSYYLLNTTTEKFALFFERSNSKGIQLNFIDILAAKLYDGFNLREKIEEFEENNKEYELNREIIVRSISLIVSEFKQIDRTFILSNLSAEHFNKYWDSVCLLYKNCTDFLYKNNFIISQSWMPYQNQLIPLMMFLNTIGGDFSQMSEKQYKFIHYWYWSSIFSERYSGSSNEVIIQDSKNLQFLAKNSFINDKSFFNKIKIQIDNSEELYSYNKKGSAIYRGILNFINYESKGLMDWKNSSKLSFNSKLEDHHIFPKEYLKNLYKADDDILELIDSVANRTLIPKITNIKIGKRKPSDYLGELLKSNSNLQDNLNNHFIVEGVIESLYDDEYKLFLEERAQNIFNSLKTRIIDTKSEVIFEYLKE